MKSKQKHSKLRIYSAVSILIILIGIMLICYMIIVEDELGAVPLLIVTTGTIWFIYTQTQLNKNKKTHNVS
jgi:c-di-AMP phosphodiesterase-like protein